MIGVGSEAPTRGWTVRVAVRKRGETSVRTPQRSELCSDLGVRPLFCESCAPGLATLRVRCCELRCQSVALRENITVRYERPPGSSISKMDLPLRNAAFQNALWRFQT